MFLHLQVGDFVTIGLLVVLEGLLSADNALVMAVMVLGLPRRDHHKALRYGLVGGFALRVAATLLAAYLIEVAWIKLAGGVYLGYLTWSHFRQSGGSEGRQGPPKARPGFGLSTFWATVVRVEVVNLAFSIDSILVAVAMSPKLAVVLAGGILGIIAMRLVVGQLLELIRRYPALVDGAFVIIGWVALKLSIEYAHEIRPDRLAGAAQHLAEPHRHHLRHCLPVCTPAPAGRRRRRGGGVAGATRRRLSGPYRIVRDRRSRRIGAPTQVSGRPARRAEPCIELATRESDTAVPQPAAPPGCPLCKGWYGRCFIGPWAESGARRIAHFGRKKSASRGHSASTGTILIRRGRPVSQLSHAQSFPADGPPPWGSVVAGPAAHAAPEAWFAVWTRSRHEATVFQQLAGKGLEAFLPTVARWSYWKDRRKRVDWPLFPGYCFVRTAPTDTLRVRTCVGVVSIVSFEGRPASIPDDEIDGVRRLIGSDLRFDPCPLVHEGDSVEVIRGPLRGVVGRLVRKGAHARLIVSVGLIGQGVMVDVDAGHVRAY